jgi:hypothetical protein
VAATNGNGNRPVIVIASQRRSHELFLLGYALLVGALYVTGTYPLPPQITGSLAGWQQPVWAWSWVVSGVTGFTAAGWRGLLFALRMEQAAMLIGAAPLLIMTVAVLHPIGLSTATAALLLGAWTLANLDRAWQIRLELRRIHRAVGHGR